MSITAATILGGLYTGITHPLTTFGLMTANTVMNGIELHNDQEMKGSLSRIESTQDKIIEGIESLQVSTSHTVTYSQMEKLLSEPVPAPTQTVQQPASNQAPTPAQTPAPDNNPPAWAQQLMQQQVQQAEVIKTLMQQQNTASTPVPANTTVNVNPTAAAPATTTPASTAPAPTTTPAPQPVDESALDAKLDKLITGFAAFVDLFNQQANSGNAPATGSAGAAKTGD